MAAAAAVGAAVVLAWAIVINSTEKLIAWDGNYRCTGSGGCVRDVGGQYKTWSDCASQCAGQAQPFYECRLAYVTPQGQPVYNDAKPCKRVFHPTQFATQRVCSTECSQAQYFDTKTCEPVAYVTEYKGSAGFERCMKATKQTPNKGGKCPANCNRMHGKYCDPSTGTCTQLTCNDVCPGQSGGYMGWNRGALVDSSGCGMNCTGLKKLECDTCQGEMCYTCIPMP